MNTKTNTNIIEHKTETCEPFVKFFSTLNGIFEYYDADRKFTISEKLSALRLLKIVTGDIDIIDFCQKRNKSITDFVQLVSTLAFCIGKDYHHPRDAIGIFDSIIVDVIMRELDYVCIDAEFEKEQKSHIQEKIQEMRKEIIVSGFVKDMSIEFADGLIMFYIAFEKEDEYRKFVYPKDTYGNTIDSTCVS